MADFRLRPRIFDKTVYLLIALMFLSFNLSVIFSLVAVVQLFLHFGLNLAMLGSYFFQLCEMVCDIVLIFVVVKRTFKLGWGALRQELHELVGKASQLRQSLQHRVGPDAQP